MTRHPSHDERLARLAARGRVRNGTPATAPRPPVAGNPWAPPAPPINSVTATGWSAAAGYQPTARPAVAPTGRTTPRPGRHHPARRSRIATAGVSTALLFGGIGYLSASQVYAGTQSSSVDQGAGTDIGGQLLPADDPAAQGSVDDRSDAPGTLPPTVPPTAVPVAPPSSLAPSVAAPVAPQSDPAAVDQAAIDQAAADQAAADAAAAATDPPTTVRRVPRTAAPRPKCTGSHC